MLSPVRWSLGAPLAVAALVVLGGCGASVSIGSKTLDTGDIQTQLAKQIAPQGGYKVSDVTVTCPDGPKVQKGLKFTCRLKTKDGKNDVKVVVTETNDSGHITATVPAQ